MDPGASPTQIAARLRQVAEMLRLQGENRFRAAAYEGGAEAVEGLTEALSTLVDENRLTEVQGIGPSLAAIITDLVRTGNSPTVEGIMGALPVGVLELAHLPGMTLRRIRALRDTLGVGGRDDLRAALESGAVESVRGFGPRTVAKLREAVAQPADPPARVLLVDALAWAARLVGHLRGARSVIAVEAVGSVRRWVETVGDLNLLVASDDPVAVRDAFAGYPAVGRVQEGEGASWAARLTNGLAVTLAVEPPARFAVALVRCTGAKAHVRRLEARARERGLALEELRATDEAAIYGALELPWIPPELREDAGELEAALAGDTFEDLITEKDIRGMVHCHSVYSDGRDTIVAMADAASRMGMEYLTITDHSPSASYAGGVPVERLRDQWREIAEVQAQRALRLFRGTESDILVDGALDYPDEVIRSLDVVVASIHQRHKLSASAMTARLVAAMRHPSFKIWGHALGRLLLRRPPIDCDVEQVLDVVARSRAAIEVNGSPHRMDLPAEWLRVARGRGIKFVVSTDAHSTAELLNLRFGVALARRGGLRRSDVLNTLGPDQFAAAVSPRTV